MKYISVYDAVKLATKGPIKYESGKGKHFPSILIRSQFSDFEPVIINAGGWKLKRHEANATLLAHFFNHGPALLAMLEEFVKLQEPFRKQLDANETEILDESIALIAKASKVEIEE